MNNVIGIEVNNQFLDLNQAGIRIEKINPFFSPSVYQGDYSFPFTLPATEKNMKTLGFVNLVDVSEKVLSYTATVYIYGLPQFSLKLSITKVRLRSIDVILKGGIRSLNTADKKLTEFFADYGYSLGNYQAEITQKATLISKEKNWNVYGFTFVPFYAPNFYSGKNNTFCGVMNRMNSTNGDIYENSGASPNKYALVPFFFLFYLLNEIWKAEGLSPTGSFWEHPELKTLLVFNNYAIDARIQSDDTKLLSNGVLNLTFSGQRPTLTANKQGAFDFAAAWDYGSQEYVITKAGDYSFSFHLNGQSATTASLRPPHPYPGSFEIYHNATKVGAIGINRDWSVNHTYLLNYSFSAGAGNIGDTIHVEFAKNTDVGQAQTYFEMSNEAFAIIAINDSVISTSDKFRFKNHMPPDWTVGQLLKEVKNLGVHIEFDFQNNQVKLDIVDELLNIELAEDKTAISEPLYENNVEGSLEGISLGFEFADDEKAEIDIVQDQYVGEFSDFSELPLPSIDGQLAILTNTNEVVQVQPSGAANAWVSIGHNYKPKVYGKGSESAKSKLAPMLMCRQNNEGGTADQNTAVMPYYPGVGSSNSYGLGINSFQPRLVFYRGENVTSTVTSPKGGKYILASTQRYGINGNLVGNYSFRLDQSSGLLLKHCDKMFKAVTNGEIVEKNLNFNALDFINLKTFQKWVIDNNLFLIKSLSIFINNRSAKVKAYLLKL